MSTQHTPTPWHDEIGAPGSSSGLTVRDENGNIIARVGSIDDAAFIVRACNAHDELVAALRGLLDATKDIRGIDPEEYKPEAFATARAALAKAGAT